MSNVVEIRVNGTNRPIVTLVFMPITQLLL